MFKTCRVKPVLTFVFVTWPWSSSKQNVSLMTLVYSNNNNNNNNTGYVNGLVQTRGHQRSPRLVQSFHLTSYLHLYVGLGYSCLILYFCSTIVGTCHEVTHYEEIKKKHSHQIVCVIFTFCVRNQCRWGSLGAETSGKLLSTWNEHVWHWLYTFVGYKRYCRELGQQQGHVVFIFQSYMLELISPAYADLGWSYSPDENPDEQWASIFNRIFQSSIIIY